MVGTSAAKERIFGMYRVKTPGKPGFCHFPNHLDEEHFQQLTAEELRVTWRKGRRVEKWEPVRTRNEALDCFVYALAALHIRGLRFLGHSAPAEQTKLNLPESGKEQKKEPVKMKPSGPSVVRGGGGFVTGF